MEFKAILTKSLAFFFILFLASFFAKWGIDTCIGIRQDSRILATGSIPEPVCNALINIDTEARKTDYAARATNSLAQQDDSYLSNVKVNYYIYRLRNFTLLFGDIPKDKEAVAIWFIAIVLSSLILGTVAQILDKSIKKEPLPPPTFRRRKTATFKIMPGFSEKENDDWRPLK